MAGRADSGDLAVPGDGGRGERGISGERTGKSGITARLESATIYGLVYASSMLAMSIHHHPS
jgi:hypothetical protein